MSLNYEAAESLCNSNGGATLATLNNEAQWNAGKNLLSKDAWVGWNWKEANNGKNEFDFMWTDGSPETGFLHEKWLNNNPGDANPGSEKCVVIQQASGLVFDVPCDQTKAALCSKQFRDLLSKQDEGVPDIWACERLCAREPLCNSYTFKSDVGECKLFQRSLPVGKSFIASGSPMNTAECVRGKPYGIFILHSCFVLREMFGTFSTGDVCVGP